VGTGKAGKNLPGSRLRFAASTALALLATANLAALGFAPAIAQGLEELRQDVSANAQLALQADTIVYNRDNQTVSAVGGVRIDYDGNKLVARKVTYNERTARLIAEGNVEIIDKDGNRIYSDKIDITDDFRDGFVNALRVETTDNTRFAAIRAERTDGNVTTFDKGVYTACEPCLENPQKPPIWQIKAQKIIWNGQAKTIRFEGARFEFFGFSLSELPAFEIADHTVKRKTGFLIPRIRYKSELGAGLSVPFYLALSPHYDLTLTGTGYTKQGFLGEAEWRQQFDNGSYNVRIAGIHQAKPEAFTANTEDSANEGRAMIGTKGSFALNPRWTFGWDILAQTDKNFSRTYEIEDFDQAVHTSQIYLTGLNDRNYFDLRALKFDVQEAALDSNPGSRQEKQPWVLPSFDYSITPDAPIAGGELNFDINARVLDRDTADFTNPAGSALPDFLTDTDGDGQIDKLTGAAGTNGRITAEAEWKRTIIVPGGLALTPLLALRGDGFFNDLADNPSAAAVTRSEVFRGLATAGLEARWPVVFSTTSATHILEPVGQIFVRNDERFAGTGDLLNEDAQSMVFDASNLFDRDKFSGYDRMEGGTRVNFGLRYSGLLANGWGTNAVFGQSIHLAGVNSFAAPDYVNAGAYSGLETDRSDYVGAISLNSPSGLTVSAGGRFDERNWRMRRGEIEAAYTGDVYATSARYTFIQAQPQYGFNRDRHEIGGSARVKFDENWSAFGSTAYDLESRKFVSNSLGFGYADECFAYNMTYGQTRDANDEIKHTVGFNVSFRTLGDFGSGQSTN
jgi:LPS-assembly protein